MWSNQGRMLYPVLDDVDREDLTAAAQAGWTEVHNHPAGATCECVAMEVLARLYELGYRLVKEQGRDGSTE